MSVFVQFGGKGGGPKRKTDWSAMTFVLPGPGQTNLYVSQNVVDDEKQQFRGTYIRGGPANAAGVVVFWSYNAFTFPQNKKVVMHTEANSNYGGGGRDEAMKKLYELEFGGSPKRMDRSQFEKLYPGQEFREVFLPQNTYIPFAQWNPQTPEGVALKQNVEDDVALLDACWYATAPLDCKAFEATVPADPNLAPWPAGTETRAERTVDKAVMWWPKHWSKVAKVLCSSGFENEKQVFRKHKARYLKAFVAMRFDEDEYKQLYSLKLVKPYLEAL